MPPIDHKNPARLSPDDSSRPVDWRWQRASYMRASAEYADIWKADNDHAVLTAYEFQVLEAQARDGLDFIRLKRKWPRLYAAYAIWSDKNRLPRHELEARIMAREEPESIAHKLAIPDPRSVQWYEDLFFHARDRLDNRGYVGGIVIGESLHYGATERDLDILWKTFGWRCGPAMLDILCQRDFPMPKLGDAQGFAAAVERAVQAQVGLKALLATFLMPINNFTQQVILDTYTRLEEIRRMADNGSGRDVLIVSLENMFTGMPWQVGSRPHLRSAVNVDDVVGRLPEEVLAIDASELELRDHELAELTNGNNPFTVESTST